MINNLERISLNKYLLISNLIESKDSKKLFSHYDELLMTKRFSNAKDLSITENILCLDAINLTGKDIIKIVSDFIKNAQSPNILKKRNIYELAKVSNLQSLKLNKALSDKILNEIGDSLLYISSIATNIGVDFVILRILDNFIVKLKNSLIKNQYNAIRKNILRKMVNFLYEKEKKEKTITYFCWIDRLLVAVQKDELSLNQFMEVSIKILKLTPNCLDVCWKILQSVNFLCFQPLYNDSNKLRKFKRDILKIIKQKYITEKITPQSAIEIMISTLARDIPSKEDFYYLFDTIKIISQQSQENKLFALDLCNYILFVNNRQSIFCYRFIREYFMSILNDIVKEDDNFSIKEKEITLFLSLLHEKSFFFLHKSYIFSKLVELISFFNNKNISSNKFYKYCDIIDYIIYKNPDIKLTEVLDKLSKNEKNAVKISKRFDLSKSA